MLPDLESLRCFTAAADHLSFRVAAKSVGLSPAAFGERIKRLEDSLGIQLFERTTRKVTLTTAGEHLRPQARRCLAEAERCAEVVRHGGAEMPHSLIVGTRFELGMSWLVPALGRLEEAMPGRTLHTYFGDTPDLLPRLRRDEIDCLITSFRLADPGLAYLPLHEERYAFVGQRRLLQGLPLARASDATGHRLLDAHADLPLFRYFLDTRPPGEAWSFARVQHLGTIGAIRARTLEGAGVAVLPRYFIQKDLAAKRLQEPFPRARLASDWFRLIWRAGHPRESLIRQLGTELAALPLR